MYLFYKILLNNVIKIGCMHHTMQRPGIILLLDFFIGFAASISEQVYLSVLLLH